MKVNYLTILERELSSLLEGELNFCKVGSACDELPSGWVLYEGADRQEVKFYLVLAPNPKNDSYTVEIAWSSSGKFPSMMLPMFLSDDPVDGDFRFRIGEFWGDHDYWELFIKRDIKPEYQNIKDNKEAKLKSSARAIVDILNKYFPAYKEKVLNKN